MSVEKGLDELWIGVKFQSNTEIAGSPRNSFRASVVLRVMEVSTELARGKTLTEPYQTPNAIHLINGSQTVGDKSHCQKGNSPDQPLRSRSPD